MRVILVAVFAALLVVNFADSKKHATNDYFAPEELQENFVDELMASDELRKDSGTTCSEPMVRGRCKAYLPRWYFDSTTGRCSEFIYGGCGGNSNNFKSQDSCQAECEKPCEQSKEIGSGRGLFPRWYFDKSTGKCMQFSYGGSGGNLNNFETEGDCEAKCETEKEISEPQCKQPKKPGDCRAAYKRWYFDSDLQKCEEFIYGGCGENENNFETEQDCQAACGSTAEKKSWKLLGENVCFEAKGDRYGVTHTPSDVVGYLVAVRLQYKSGKVTCSKAANKYSKWGCSGLDNDHWYYGSQYVGVIITNRNNKQILPHVNTNHGFYHVPDFTANSPQLTLRRDKQTPAYVPGKSELRIWYGEDWSNWAEYDNAGKVCADVYGQFYTSCEE